MAKTLSVTVLQELMCDILDAQKIDPYTGWDMAALNKAAAAARDYLLLPSIEDLNPHLRKDDQFFMITGIK